MGGYHVVPKSSIDVIEDDETLSGKRTEIYPKLTLLEGPEVNRLLANDDRLSRLMACLQHDLTMTTLPTPCIEMLCEKAVENGDF